MMMCVCITFMTDGERRSTKEVLNDFGRVGSDVT